MRAGARTGSGGLGLTHLGTLDKHAQQAQQASSKQASSKQAGSKQAASRQQKKQHQRSKQGASPRWHWMHLVTWPALCLSSFSRPFRAPSAVHSVFHPAVNSVFLSAAHSCLLTSTPSSVFPSRRRCCLTGRGWCCWPRRWRSMSRGGRPGRARWRRHSRRMLRYGAGST